MGEPEAQVVGLKALHLQGEVGGVGEVRKVTVIDALLKLLDEDPDPRAAEVAKRLREQLARLEQKGQEGRGDPAPTE